MEKIHIREKILIPETFAAYIKSKEGIGASKKKKKKKAIIEGVIKIKPDGDVYSRIFNKLK